VHSPEEPEEHNLWHVTTEEVHKTSSIENTEIWTMHSYDILGARMLWKPKEARILTNFIDQPV
jgi:hypothetical protein